MRRVDFLTRVAQKAEANSQEEVDAALAIDLIEQDIYKLENWPAARMFVTRILKQHNYEPREQACSCAQNLDGTVTTMLRPDHAATDLCLTMSQVAGKRRKGSIVKGICTKCGWEAQK